MSVLSLDVVAESPAAMHAVADVHETADSPIVIPVMPASGDCDQEVPFQTSAIACFADVTVRADTPTATQDVPVAHETS